MTVRVSLTERVSIEAAGVVVDEQRFPGRQGRLVFAYLVAAGERPVPRGELAEALWDEHPPERWEKALSVLVSKLRALLNECGIDGASSLKSAFGCYKLTLPEGAWIDVDAAADAVEQAELALAAGDLDAARAQASLAAELARRTFLPGEDGLWVDEQRRELQGVLVRALECLGDAASRTGEFAEAVRHATEVTELEPFRESSHRRLMRAHASAGNPAEALRAYERCRRFLASELGAYPSPATESIYRELLSLGSAPDRTARQVAPPAPAQQEREAEHPRREEPVPRPAWRRRRPVLVALALSGAIALAATLALGDAGKSPPQAAASAPRVALIVPRAPRPDEADTYVTPLVDGLRVAERELGVDGEIFVLDERDPTSPGARRTVERVRAGRFDLVLAANIAIAQPFASVTLPGTRWVVFDSPVDVADATGFLFDDRQAGFLAGYLSGLVERMDGPRLNRAHAVSVIGGVRGVSAMEELIAGFKDGARRALPDVTVYTAYSNDFVDQSKCEALANRHIDRGADIVFAAAGTCSLGALSAAGLRGVWAVGTDGDRSHLGPHILASTVKRGDEAVVIAVRSFLNHTLPGGETLTLGLDDGVVGLVGLSPSVPDSIRRDVASMTAALRKAHGPT